MKKQNLLAAAQYLQKLAAGEDMNAAHEAAESPQMESAEHGNLAEIQQLMEQLSPEEQQQLLEYLMSEQSPEQEGEMVGDAGDEDNHAALAQAIEEHLAQNPEASSAGLPPEKAASLNFVKSASYIEGFLKQASSRGFSTEQSVNLYDQSLASTISELRKQASSTLTVGRARTFGEKAREAASNFSEKAKEHARRAADYVAPKDYEGKRRLSGAGKAIAGTAAGATALGAGALAMQSKNEEDKEKEAELKGDQHKIDVNKNGKIDSDDLAKLRNKSKPDNSEEEKTAAYYEGVLERAREYGFSDAEAIQIVKSALMN